MISFFVRGIPVQKGNHKAVCPTCSFGRKGHAYIVDDWTSDLGKRLHAWSRAIVSESMIHRPLQPWSGAVGVEYWFFFTRPKSNKSDYPISCKIPDYDKLARAANDALQVKGKQGGVIMGDDGYIMDAHEHLRWCGFAMNPGEPISEIPGVLVKTWSLEPRQLTLDGEKSLPSVEKNTKRLFGF